jgi:hypothetical protein
MRIVSELWRYMIVIAAQATDVQLNSTLMFIFSENHKVIVECFRILEELFSLKTST